MNRTGFHVAFLLVIGLGLFDLLRASSRDAGDETAKSLTAHKLDAAPKASGPPASPDSGDRASQASLADGVESDAPEAEDANDPLANEASNGGEAVDDAGDEASAHGGSDETVVPLVGGDVTVDASLMTFPSLRLEPGPWFIPRASLGQRIDSLLATKALAKVRTSVCVISTADGVTLYERDPSTPRIVASNNKLFTLASALAVLGRDFQFSTKLYATGPVTAGELKGDLVIVGDGDPDAVIGDPSEKNSLIGRIVAAVAATGVKSITGSIVIDDHVFDRQYLAPQWMKSQLAHDYAAPVAGFSLFENCAVVRVRPAERSGARASYSVLPQTSLFAAPSEVNTGGSKVANVINVPAPIQVGSFKVRGETPLGKSPIPLFVPLANPGDVHPTALKDALGRAGIRAAGGARLADKRFDPAGATTLGVVKSPLPPILKKIMKESSNVLAEHVYKRVGFAKSGKGTYVESGRAAIEALRSYGIDPTGAVSVDGSGLSRGNLYSARQTASLLAALYKGSARSLMIDVLPIGGVDGTLANRFSQTAYKGRVRAKTGYINGVAALSGYATTDDGEVLCFSILMNGFKSYGSVKGVIDQIAKLLVDLQGNRK